MHTISYRKPIEAQTKHIDKADRQQTYSKNIAIDIADTQPIDST
jgi:hypothetical protein